MATPVFKFQHLQNKLVLDFFCGVNFRFPNKKVR